MLSLFIKNGDLIWKMKIKINFAQKVTAKSHEGMIKVSPLMSGESLSGDVQPVSFVYTIKQSGRGKVAFEVSVLAGEDVQLKASGTLAFVVEKSALSVKPDIKIEIDGGESFCCWWVSCGEDFLAILLHEPKDAQDFVSVLGAMFAGPELSDELLSWDALVD